MKIVSNLWVIILIVSLSFYEFVLTAERGRGPSGNRGRGRGPKYPEKKKSSIAKPQNQSPLLRGGRVQPSNEKPLNLQNSNSHPELISKSNSTPEMQGSPQQASSAEYVDSPRRQQSRHTVNPVILMRHSQQQQHSEQQELNYQRQSQYSQQHQYQLVSREQYLALQQQQALLQQQALRNLLKCNGIPYQSNTIQKNGQPQVPINGSGRPQGLNVHRAVPIQSSQSVIPPLQTQRQSATPTPIISKTIGKSHPLFTARSATETVDTTTLKVSTEASVKSHKIEVPSANIIGYDDLKNVRAQVPISAIQPVPVPQLRNFTTRQRFLQDKNDLFDDSKEKFITHPCELKEKPWLSPLYEATPLPELTRAQREVEDQFDDLLDLQCQALLVTEEEKGKRRIVLANIMNWLEIYYSRFSLSYCPDKMVPPVKILPYGSMRLGVELKGIDC